MAKDKKTPSTPAPAPILVAPPAPTAIEPGAVAPVLQQISKKVPTTGPGHFGARDERGKASRTDARRTNQRIDAPRHTSAPAERSRQPRSHKAGGAGGARGR